jgi:hypothetical protein
MLRGSYVLQMGDGSFIAMVRGEAVRDSHGSLRRFKTEGAAERVVHELDARGHAAARRSGNP